MYKVVDLFAGAGGLSLGFEQTKKYDIKVAFENNPEMQATYRLNHPDTDVRGDVCTADYTAIQEQYGAIDVVIGGPPCQGFSNANRQKNHTVNKNNMLVKQYVRAIVELQPKAFVMENVSMLKSQVHRFYLERGDEELIKKYNIRVRETPLHFIDAQYMFDGILNIIQNRQEAERHLWPDTHFSELNIIYKAAKNIEKLEKAIRTQFDIVTWTSAQIDGTRLLIRVKENDLIMTENKEMGALPGEGMDLVAGKEGEIVSIVTRSGVPKVTAGATVAKGDVLVEGGVPILNEDGTVRRYDYCIADADIMLRCLYNMKEELAKKHEEKYYSGREKEYPFILFGTKKIEMPKWGKDYETYDVVEEKKQLKLFENYYLPVYFGKDIVREYTLEEKVYTREEVKALFEEKIQNFIESLQEKGVQIIEKNVTISKTSAVWKMNVDFLAVEKTGVAQKTKLTQIQTEDEPAPDGETPSGQ